MGQQKVHRYKKNEPDTEWTKCPPMKSLVKLTVGTLLREAAAASPLVKVMVELCEWIEATERKQRILQKVKKLRNALSASTSGRYSADCIVHLERTLDEAYYLSLGAHDFESRNNDQVVSRKFRTAGMTDDRIPIFMVPQLCLWRIGGVIVSA